MRVAHLFAGAGGGLYADLILGHTPVLAIENNPYRCEVLRERKRTGWWPELAVWETDIREADPARYEGRVDCIAAGFPCQDISTAGSKRGLHGEKSGLFFEIIRFVRYFRPGFVFLENSPNITRLGLNTVTAALASCGYMGAWCCLEAAAVGAPHKRDRWWCLAADINGIRFETQTRGTPKANRRAKPRDGKRWPPEPDVVRVVHGVAYGGDRVAALGAGQVPLQAAAAWKILEREIETWLKQSP